MCQQEYYGKYRGKVVNNLDPRQMGRLQVVVPNVTGPAVSSWAMPCAPVAGLKSGMFALPVIGTRVWVEYEQGDLEYPIWVGCFWGSAEEIPPLAQATAAGAITLQTPLQNGLTITDAAGPEGGIMLKSAGGASLVINDTGIYIRNSVGASIVLRGSVVEVNGNEFTVE